MRSCLSTPPSTAKGPPARPVRRHPSAVMRRKLFCPISRKRSCNARTSRGFSTFQRIGQRGDFYRLPTERIRLRFARFSCTKTAICAMSVNHPHHINCMNHSSDKCQRALVHALLPVQPLHPPPKALQRGPYSPGPRRDARGLRQPPVCRVAPKISHTISHNLSCNAPASRLPINPFKRPKNASNVNPV